MFCRKAFLLRLSFASRNKRPGLRASLGENIKNQESKDWRKNQHKKRATFKTDENTITYDKKKKFFENVEFDEEGKFLVMHHNSAAKYYKINIAFLLLFLGFSYYNYKFNNAVFWSDRFAKFYLGIIATGIFGTYLFANKHI